MRAAVVLAAVLACGGAHAFDSESLETPSQPPARRVLVMTRQRSGSTAFSGLLGQHPKVQDMGEAVSFSHNERNLAALGITLADVQRDPAHAVERVLASCDAPTCAIKLHPEHFPSPTNGVGGVARSLLDGAPYGSVHVVRALPARRDRRARVRFVCECSFENKVVLGEIRSSLPTPSPSEASCSSATPTR